MSWTESVIRELQQTCGMIALSDRDQAHAILSRCVDGLPPPRSVEERLILRGLLFEFACRSAHHLCQRATPMTRGQSVHSWAEAVILLSFDRHADDPVEGFRAWTVTFLSELAKRCPVSPATLAARIIRQDYQDRLDVTALSRKVRTLPSRLRRDFYQEYGVSLRGYLSRARHFAALQLLPTHKVEAVVLLVGYRSRKNFYRVFRQLAAQTPSEFQRLGTETQLGLISGAERALARLRRHASLSRRRTEVPNTPTN